MEKVQETIPESQPPVNEASVAKESIEQATSAASTSAAPESVSSVVVDVPAVSPEVSVPTEIISSVPAPLQYGDLAALGLASWTPAGMCRWGIEVLHVSTGLSWFWTFIDATIISRLILFPFTVMSMRNTAKLAPFQEDVAQLRKMMQDAQATRDQLAMQKAIIQQRMIYEKAGVKMSRMALLPFVQLPVTLGMFFGVKTLCDHPLEQLKWSGLDLIPDLTVADPTYVLPVLSVALMNLQLTVNIQS